MKEKYSTRVLYVQSTSQVQTLLDNLSVDRDVLRLSRHSLGLADGDNDTNGDEGSENGTHFVDSEMEMACVSAAMRRWRFTDRVRWAGLACFGVA
mmetsp:Transcript_23597/g.65902  ORF Transcript_23597/g.65902 Transcript_23597/m.65902 type:complete len:95 (+) Transcript_23597:68-352(+)